MAIIALARDVEFSYGGRRALLGVSFDLQLGLVGLLGPNGSGKSTLLGILATVLPGYSGTVELVGLNISQRAARRDVRRRVGYLPQRFQLMPGLSAHDTACYAAWAQGIDDRMASEAATQALGVVGLTDLASVRVRQLSGGQRQRLGIACSIAHRPEVLLLDEPTVGVDRDSGRLIASAIREYAESRLVILASHILQDMATCDRLLILDQGELVSDRELSATDREPARIGQIYDSARKA